MKKLNIYKNGELRLSVNLDETNNICRLWYEEEDESLSLKVISLDPPQILSMKSGESITLEFE
jgi:hypothetical protein